MSHIPDDANDFSRRRTSKVDKLAKNSAIRMIGLGE